MQSAGYLPMITCARSSIVKMRVDAIVDAANEAFRGGGGVDGVIHDAAGPELLKECMKYPRLPTGEAILTRGYRLAARYVIHTVGPIWRGAGDESQELGFAYESVFELARLHGDIHTIAFPAISTGAFGFPIREAAEIAVRSMRLHESDFREITVCLMDAENEAAYTRFLSK